MFAAASDNPNFYQSKINCFVALAPVTSCYKEKSVLFPDSMISKATYEFLLKKMGPEIDGDLLNTDTELGKLFFYVTRLDDLLLDQISDEDPSKICDRSISNYLGHFPGGTSEKAFIHFLQLDDHKDNSFCKFDYG